MANTNAFIINDIKGRVSGGHLFDALKMLKYFIYKKSEKESSLYLGDLKRRVKLLEHQLSVLNQKQDTLDFEFVGNRRARVAIEIYSILEEFGSDIIEGLQPEEPKEAILNTKVDVTDIEITINKDLSEFDEEDQKAILKAIAEMLKLGQKHKIKINRIDAG